MGSRTTLFTEAAENRRQRKARNQIGQAIGNDTEQLDTLMEQHFSDYSGFRAVGDAFKLLGFLGVPQGVQAYGRTGDAQTRITGRTVKGNLSDKYNYVKRLSAVGIDASLQAAGRDIQISIEPASLMNFLVKNREYPEKARQFVGKQTGRFLDMANMWSCNTDSPLLSDTAASVSQEMVAFAKGRQQQKEDQEWEAAPVVAAGDKGGRKNHPRINPASSSLGKA